MDQNDFSETALIVVPCVDLDQTLELVIDRLGFRLDMIMPADSPRFAQVSGYGIHLRIEQHTKLDPSPPPTTLRLPASLRNQLQLDLTDRAQGLAIEFNDCPSISLSIPAISETLINRINGSSGWGTGRAGMHYRDLIPDRLQGQVIASHIRIVEAGLVNDYVHYHKVGMQMIYCRRGWVRVVYEDQGDPFVMHAGDCVLQPPTIRHRVLESSAGLEVIELGSPAEHETWRDHELTLPTASIRPHRSFEGQCFIRHVAADAEWQAIHNSVSFRDTGIGMATHGKAGARVIRMDASSGLTSTLSQRTDGFRFLFVLKGAINIRVEGEEANLLGTDDCCVLASHRIYSIESTTPSELLEISIPAE